MSDLDKLMVTILVATVFVEVTFFQVGLFLNYLDGKKRLRDFKHLKF